MQQIKLFLLLIINILFFSVLSISTAQVIEGDITLSSQAEVNSFAGTSITGNVYISGTDIIDLSPLTVLTSVGANLDIHFNSSLTNLDGLSNITSVGGDLYVESNSSLTNLDGLSSITSVYALYVESNSSLTNLDGLSNITYVGGDLYVKSNPSLTNLDGLSNITYVGGDLYVQSNSLLTNLDGLSNITAVGGGLYVQSNSLLTNLDGLSNITAVYGDLNVQSNSSLTNLDGLSNITYVGGDLYVQSNSLLTNLDGLSNITAVYDLYILSNTSLNSFCGLFTLLNLNGLVGSYNVSGNLVNPIQQQIKDGGLCNPTEVVENKLNTPKYYELQQNYPNPFNPETTISYQLPEDGLVTLRVFDSLGKEVTTLINEYKSSGKYNAVFKGSNLASGIYFYKITIGKFTDMRKFILMK